MEFKVCMNLGENKKFGIYEQKRKQQGEKGEKQDTDTDKQTNQPTNLLRLAPELNKQQDIFLAPLDHSEMFLYSKFAYGSKFSENRRKKNLQIAEILSKNPVLFFSGHPVQAQS